MISSQIGGLQRKGIMMQLLEQGVWVKGPEMASRALRNSYYVKHHARVHMEMCSKESPIALIRHLTGF